MNDIGRSEPNWRKSTLSAYNGNCVEVARLPDDHIGVRDSKNVSGPRLKLAPAAWRVFVKGAVDGQFDL